MKITIENMTKVYKNNNKALSNINLEIESGIFGFLGPNGAGKTTLITFLWMTILPKPVMSHS